MKSSILFGKTLRDVPSDTESTSHKLLIRAGFIQQIASGIFSLLPMGNRSISKIRNIIREEMDSIGGQEVNLPVVQPRDLWVESGRAETFSPPLASFSDRRNREMVLAPTHEEAVTVMAKAMVNSYKDLPFILYQIQTKFRDEPRPRGGLLRVREFEMKDAYSFDLDEKGLDNSFSLIIQGYERIFKRCGINVVMVQADSGGIGGKDSNEFVLLTDSGEDMILISDKGGYAANVEKAVFEKTINPIESIMKIEKISTPNITTIDKLSKLKNISKNKILKSLLYTVNQKPVLVVIRGDYDVNETKLRNLFSGKEIRLSTKKEIETLGLNLGYISPIGIKGIDVILDDSVTMGSNFFAGANEKDFHFRNVNFPRDFKAKNVNDIAQAKQGYKVKDGEGFLTEKKGIEVGHVFKLGTTYSSKMNAKFSDQRSNSKDILMGCYGIGIGRLLAAIVEVNNDDKGMILPPSVAPFEICLVPINLNDQDVIDYTNELYKNLIHKGLEVLFDDRDSPPGVKFQDIDLIGIPIRLVVSSRNLKNKQIELKLRSGKDVQLFSIKNIETEVFNLLRNSEYI
tara:strand:- start:1854 stop:3563 length:1710 start_codon:yes stop_codon:yes gene_type:complete